MNTQVVGIVGFMGSGKNTVAQRFQHHNFAIDSFAAPLKDVVSSIFGWERDLMEGDTEESREFRETPDIFWSRKLGIPEFTPRLSLQMVGTDVMRRHFYEDIWLNSLEYRIRKKAADHSGVVISDVRFKNELNLVKHMGGVTIWVHRGELPEWYHVAIRANRGDAASASMMRTRYGHVHESEWDWVGHDVDIVLDNNSDVDRLHRQVDQIVHSL